MRPIKARRHHGTNSLDLTIPSEFRKEFGIAEGDVFLPEAEKTQGKVRLVYKRIHPMD